ncbi:MAG: hypothetical protein ACI9YO_000677 [Gammaproteobacteria bacterium]|jgi:uncharacterized membrane protein YedE/YeeE
MIETSNTILLVALAGTMVGLMLGITMVWTRFCTMGAVADIAISGNYGRMRSWLLAICVAIVGTQIATATELIDITQTSYLQSYLYLPAAIIGGGMFGFGMVFACGCGARSLVMIGCGDLRALISVMVLGTFAYMTIRGIFAVPRTWFYSATALDTSSWLPYPSVDSIFSDTFDLKDSTSRLLATTTVISPLLWFIFKDDEFRRSIRRIFAGITVGSLVVAGWLSTGWIVSDDFEEVALGSLTFVDPVGDSLQYLMIWTGATITFGVAVVGGAIVGGLITSICRKEFYIRGFEDASEMGRYMGGGALMGMGGAIAGGCTFGQGITGVSTLGFASFLALGSIIIGAFIGIRCLEQGSFTGAIGIMWRGLLER